MARVPYVTAEQLAPENRDLLPPSAINIRRALLNSPNAARRMGQMAEFIRHQSRLDPRLRELAILQVGYLTRCAYEYVHHIEIGRGFGVSDDDIRALADETAGRPSTLEPLAKAVLKAAREMTAGLAIADETYAVLRRSLDNERMVDLVVAVAAYNATVRVLESLEVDVEPGYEALLAAFPLPAA